MKRRSVAVVAFLTAWTLYGCSQPAGVTPSTAAKKPPMYGDLKMKYRADLRKVLPVISPGATLDAEGSPHWLGGTPCMNTSGPCMIKVTGNGKVYRFRCAPATPCDPDILVDDGSGPGGPPIVKGAAVSAAAISATVAIYCDQNDANQYQTFVDPDDLTSVHRGDTVGWAVIGDVGTSGVMWHLSLTASDCSDYTGQINQDNPTCRIAAAETHYTAIVTSAMCTESGDAVIRDTGKKPPARKK
jgi:hypothetical protein